MHTTKEVPRQQHYGECSHTSGGGVEISVTECPSEVPVLSCTQHGEQTGGNTDLCAGAGYDHTGVTEMW